MHFQAELSTFSCRGGGFELENKVAPTLIIPLYPIRYRNADETLGLIATDETEMCLWIELTTFQRNW